jgi:hypothetical protein
MMTLNDRYPFFFNPQNYYFDARLYGISPRHVTELTQSKITKFLFLYLNSIFTSLQLEMLGRSNLGEGGLDVKVYEYNRILILPLVQHIAKGLDSFNRIIKFQPYSIIEQTSSAVKKLLDEFLLQTECFSQAEIQLMHSSLAEMIQARLEKARTIY